MADIKARRIEFQSTLPHGSDLFGFLFRSDCSLFQSTLPHGSDVNQCFAAINDLNFNPRSLTGAT